MTLAVEVDGQTDVGCVRANNEDNFGYDSRYGIFVVGDGMGGQAAVEVASKMGVDILLEYFRQEGKNDSYEMNCLPGAGAPGNLSQAALVVARPIHLANRTRS